MVIAHSYITYDKIIHFLKQVYYKNYLNVLFFALFMYLFINYYIFEISNCNVVK